MSFLNDLGDQISSQFSIGENTNVSLDGSIADGQKIKYGSLGDFASKFDQSARRSYVEEGYLRKDPYNCDPKQLEILLQEPEATILVKKRTHSSLSENFRPDFMDADEKLYYRAMNILMQNKCNQISALEKLSKIQKITAATGKIDVQLIPWIISLTDSLSNGLDQGSNLFGALGANSNYTQFNSKFISVVDRLRTIYAYNQPNDYTTWITNSTNLFQSAFGTGNGVIEITNFTSLNTTTTVNIQSPGNFNISIVDPYEAMLITEFDIEKALSDATNFFYNKKSFQFGLTSAEQVIADKQNQLNVIREARKASPITVKVDADTLLGRRVTAIIDRIGVELKFEYNGSGALGFIGLGGAGGGVSVKNEYLKNGSVAGFDGLDTASAPMGPDHNIKRLVSQSELTLFQSLIAAIYNKIQLSANSTGALRTQMELTNYARKKLRFNLLGQLIIQSMDTVHIYINSKSRYDNKVLSGLQQMLSGAGILQNINNTLTDAKNTVDSFLKPSGSIPFQIEKATYVGPDFPNFLWSMLRGQFVNEKEGTHVFAGVVETVSDSWSDGRFTVDVGGKDNTIYFEMGKVNFKPGVDAFNGAFFDPLTPFESKSNSVSNYNVKDSQTLLKENKELLADTNKLSLVKSKLGPNAGSKVTQYNYIQDMSISPVTGKLTKVFYAPDGLVYRWKEGIGVFTQFGNSFNINDPNLIGNINPYEEPFAGLDIMNVLSLLITGIPYNYATYFKATSNLNGINSDPESKRDAAYLFTNSLRNDLVKRNALWGNFIPFKNLVMDEATLVKSQEAQTKIQKINEDLEKKFKQLSDLSFEAATYGAVNALVKSEQFKSTTTTQEGNIKATEYKADLLIKDINGQINDITNETNQFSASNNDLGFSQDTNQLLDGKSEASNSKLRRYLRKQINYLTRRMSYDIRANQDKNLFIVDDSYDADYDIIAFNQALSSGVKMYDNTYSAVREKIVTVANLLNLEVFCDTQGHIRVRQPQYNRMPSSVFYNMMYLKQATGVQIFPQFISDMFSNQLENIRSKIELIEDQIRLDCAILGYKASADSDTDSLSFINAQSLTGGLSGTFHFISNTSGYISNISDLILQATNDSINNIPQSLSDYSKIKDAGTSTKGILGVKERFSILQDTLQKQIFQSKGINPNPNSGSSPLNSSIVQDLISRINSKSGQIISNRDYMVGKTSPDMPIQAIESTALASIDYFKVTKEITDNIIQWQSAVKLFYHYIKNAIEFKSIDNNSSVSTGLMVPGVFGNSNIPEVFEHMIEDESYDDYGLGSGKRYIIKRSQIRNIRVAVNPPPFTTVEVHGTLNTFAPNANVEGLNSFPDGGNGMVTAFAIDYDLWRNYGFKSPAKLDLPFLSDPETQCAPYAAMVLSRNRAEILNASVMISGNEFMQPGEVVYLPDRQLLFYITSVKHTFHEGGSFTTSLELSYGHAPGEYIPTYLDIFGKLIYKNKDDASMIIQRQESSGSDSNIGIIRLPPNKDVNVAFMAGQQDQQINSVAISNSTTINNILYNIAYKINLNNSKGNNIKVSVELRFYNDNDNNVYDLNVAQLAEYTIKVLTGQVVGPKIDNSGKTDIQQLFLKPEDITWQVINIKDNVIDRRSPSQQAFNAARDIAASLGGNSNNNVRAALLGYIVDCWATITDNTGK